MDSSLRSPKWEAFFIGKIGGNSSGKAHVFDYYKDIEFIKIVPEIEAPYLAKRSIFEFFNK